MPGVPKGCVFSLQRLDMSEQIIVFPDFFVESSAEVHILIAEDAFLLAAFEFLLGMGLSPVELAGGNIVAGVVVASAVGSAVAGGFVVMALGGVVGGEAGGYLLVEVADFPDCLLVEGLLVGDYPDHLFDAPVCF